MIISVILMTLDHRKDYLEGVRSAIAVIIYPVQYMVDMPFSAGNWLGENLVSRESLLEQNQRLHTENTVLKGQLQKMISLELENMRLRKLLDSSYQVGEHVLVGELVAVDLDPFTRQVTINKGTKHNVFVGQPILDAEGVFGQLIHASFFTSQAMLITDPSHALPVQLNRTGLRAIAAGTGNNNRLELLHIPNNADIEPGDLLSTSGLGGTFPAGYPVARVTSVAPDTTQPYATVYAEPMAKLDRSREVLLVWPDNQPILPASDSPAMDTAPEQPAEESKDAQTASAEEAT